MTTAPAPATLPDLLRHRVQAAPGDTAIVCDDASATYAGLQAASRDVARHLMAVGVGKGDRVGLIMPNGIDWAVVALAVACSGAVLVPLSTLLRPPELRAHLAAADVTTLITVPSYRNRDYPGDLAGVLGDLPLLRRLHVWGEDWEPGPRRPEPDVRPADDLAVLFTSGSRGTPKGTIHTHGGALRAVAASLQARRLGPGDRLYIPMPFFWTGGFATGLLSSLVAGATLLTETEPEPGRTIEFLKRERVTLFRGWPQQAARIAAHPGFDPAALPHLRDGSLQAVLPATRRAGPGARANLFGMTETLGPWAGYRLDTDLPPGKSGSCGRPFPGVEAKVVDPRTREPVPPGHPGEVLLRGDTIMRGICGRERHDVFDADGYYPTGDLGRLDADGFFWYDGRLDDMFKVRGATVYPAEVEKGLLRLPGVTLALVTDVPSEAGAEVGAAVVGDGLDPATLHEASREALSSFKVPALWLPLASEKEIPRLASDKPDKRALQRLLRERGIRIR